VTLLLLATFLLMAIFRKSLFVNPVVQSIIQRSQEEDKEEVLEDQEL
jgi:hypothetical protein